MDESGYLSASALRVTGWHLSFAGDEGAITMLARYDNLGKGASRRGDRMLKS
jgi:N-acetyl-gamma-glutamylphosphate reductase